MLQKLRVSLGTQVQDYVKQLLLDGRLPLETAIPVDAIAADLGVSRQPVLEAVRRLGQDGFINIVPQVGSFPRRYDISEIIDFFKLFAESECVVVRLGCERAEPAEIARMKAISQEIGKLEREAPDGEELARQYRSLNRRFHSEIRASAKSAAVSEAVERMGDQSDFHVAMASAPIFMKRLKVAHQEHESMISAFEARDADQAVSIMRQHVLAIAERIARQNEAS